MKMPPTLKNPHNINISLPFGETVALPLYNLFLKKYTGKSPNFDFGKKPFVNYDGKPIFAELAILKLFVDSGWDGIWVETYGGINFLKNMPNDWKLRNNNISIPKEKSNLLKNIWKTGKTTACFDVLVWKNDTILFCESKHKGKDRLTKAQLKFIEGALSCGIKKESLLIIEWQFKD